MKEYLGIKMNQVVQRLLAVAIIFLIVALVASQYFLLAEQSPFNLSLVSAIEGEELDAGYIVVRVHIQVKGLMVESIEPPLQDGVIRVYIDHQLVGTLDGKRKSFPVSSGQKVELEAEGEGEYLVCFSIEENGQKVAKEVQLQRGRRQMLQWEQ